MFEKLLEQWANEQGFGGWSQDHAAVLRNLSKWLNKHAVEHRLHADGALCKCENIESAIIRLICKDCGLPLRPAGKA